MPHAALFLIPLLTGTAWPASTPAPVASTAWKPTAEIWIEPLGTAVFPALSGPLDLEAPFYFAAGVTVDFAPHWELVGSFGVLTGAVGGDEDSAPSHFQQFWVSAAVVHTWYFGVFGPRAGFFAGPKLTYSNSHADAYSTFEGNGTYNPSLNAFIHAAVTAWALELGYEAGFRFQFSHFDLTLTLPGISIGYEHNRAEAYAAVAGSEDSHGNGVGYDVDFNLLRLGVNF